MKIIILMEQSVPQIHNFQTSISRKIISFEIFQGLLMLQVVSKSES